MEKAYIKEDTLDLHENNIVGKREVACSNRYGIPGISNNVE